MSYQTLELVKEGNIATLYLNRVDSLNAMDVQMLKDLSECLSEISISNITLLFITGRGRAFSAGGDLKSMLSSPSEDGFKEVMDNIKNIIVTLYTMPAITVSLINGPVAGLGLSFALACDSVLAERKSKVAMNFINIGLVPDGGGHFFLKKRLGEHLAKQVIWKGESMDSDKALEMGLIDEIYRGDTEEQIELMKRRLGARPIKAMIASKILFSSQEKQELIQTLEFETISQLEMRRTEDHREGVAAFLEKRAPQFTGK
ncbi:enoyl-CoA hydratase [Metabacillus niabensis]|uniref:enoyl-CoA hydratase n=1 Tax=Metabacillus niabensis TaxID=324854 RepID=UPI001CFC0502|nr:enoyl-CoA hydratase [Metabacillus niabensis]